MTLLRIQPLTSKLIKAQIEFAQCCIEGNLERESRKGGPVLCHGPVETV